MASSEVKGRAAVAPGVRIHYGAVPERITEPALRLLNLHVAAHGLDPRALYEWASTTAFPNLRWATEIIAVRDYVEGYLGLTEAVWHTPQIIYRYPDSVAEWPLTYHVDEDDFGQPFNGIIGVPLTRAYEVDGGLIVDAGFSFPVELEAGDLVEMEPWVSHAAGLNRGPNVRCVLYFRY